LPARRGAPLMQPGPPVAVPKGDRQRLRTLKPSLKAPLAADGHWSGPGSIHFDQYGCLKSAWKANFLPGVQKKHRMASRCVISSFHKAMTTGGFLGFPIRRVVRRRLRRIEEIESQKRRQGRQQRSRSSKTLDQIPSNVRQMGK
jgi:hypothetical protein